MREGEKRGGGGKLTEEQRLVWVAVYKSTDRLVVLLVQGVYLTLRVVRPHQGLEWDELSEYRVMPGILPIDTAEGMGPGGC